MSEVLATVKGQCQCGAARFEAQLTGLGAHACHCLMCRRQTSGPQFAVDANHPVAFEDETAVGVYQSSEWGERGFCKTCGTLLFWRTRDHSFGSINPFTLEDAPDFAFESEIFIDQKPDFYDFAGDRTRMTGEEVFAQFPAGEE